MDNQDEQMKWVTAFARIVAVLSIIATIIFTYAIARLVP
jgi:hypothetical protein